MTCEIFLMKLGGQRVWNYDPFKTVWSLVTGKQWSLLDQVSSKEEAVYVLHAFQKKKRKTSRKDVEIARARFNQIGGNE